MITRTIIFIFPLIMSDICVLAHEYHVEISTDGPIVTGGTIHFLATLYNGNKVADTDTTRQFYWKDNAIPQHSKKNDIRSATDMWAVTYEADQCTEGIYIVNVVVKNCMDDFICYEIASARKYFEIREPISNVNVTGKTSIRHGDLLSLQVGCKGSGNLKYCVHYKVGSYKVTGNETCQSYISLDACDFHILRYLSGFFEYTVVIIIKNEVSKVVQPVEVNFYAKDGWNWGEEKFNLI